MAIRSLRILCQFDFPSRTFRLYDGSGPFLDLEGNIWIGCSITEGLDKIESALNGEEAWLHLGLSGTDPRILELAGEDRRSGEVIGARVQIKVQPCDEYDQPVGEADVHFTGKIDNMSVASRTEGDNVIYTVTIEIANRMVLRSLLSGQVLSDVNQRARSAILNPGAPPDRVAERVAGLADHEEVWPQSW